MDKLANYISYAKDKIAIIGDIAADRLKKEYTKMRNLGKSHNNITATPRLLESMIRLS
jgi:DNA replicative helicase MCM subunit Mcm2 (Cdc46/Mcm family)